MNQMQILEVGCGKGRNAAVLARRFQAHVVGTDVDTATIDRAKGLHPELEFRVMGLESLDFADQSFDRVYAIDVLEHVDDLHRAVGEIARVLKPGGLVVINVPAEKSERWLLRVRPSYHQDIHHVRIFTDGQLEQLFAEYGLRLRACSRHGFIDHLLLYYLFTHTKYTDSQLGIGSWRNSIVGMVLFAIQTYTKPELIFTSWLWVVPVWIVTIPVGWVINGIGNRFFPKSMYYEFTKPV